MPFTFVIIGRPNVGKSTLFNRLVGQKLALVDDAPGVTRDRREGEAQLGDLHFTVIDTAGLDDEGAKGSLIARMLARSTASSTRARRRTPAVSISTKSRPSRWKGTRMLSRVVPGCSLAITRSSPIRRLISVDLPTLGRPIMTNVKGISYPSAS